MTNPAESSLPPPEEPKMEIHKPKPVHSWRELLWEVGIIVLSIVIAISMEQLVETWHWSSEVKVARQAIAAEIATNNTKFFARRIVFAPCNDRQISEARAMIADIEAKRKPRPFTSFHLSSGSLLNDSEWQSERASQVLTHFPRSELALLSRYYTIVQHMDNYRDAEVAAWRELSLLRFPTAELGLAELNRLRVDIIAAQQAESLITLDSATQLRTSKQLGIPTPPVDPLLEKSFCSMDEEHYQAFLRSRP